MLLRRLVGQLKQQHWTGVAIELMIVVLGVFIGMQVSNWNAERETAQRAAVFSARLTEDLREEDWGYQLLIDYNRQVLASANRAANALEGGEPADDEAFRMTVPNAVQRALAKACGDKITAPGDYAAIEHVLDYPCQTGLEAATAKAAADALRANPQLLPLLRLRVADIETRIADMTGNNRPLMNDLREIAGRPRLP
jgi:hypothetical protein